MSFKMCFRFHQRASRTQKLSGPLDGLEPPILLISVFVLRDLIPQLTVNLSPLSFTFNIFILFMKSRHQCDPYSRVYSYHFCITLDEKANPSYPCKYLPNYCGVTLLGCCSFNNINFLNSRVIFSLSDMTRNRFDWHERQLKQPWDWLHTHIDAFYSSLISLVAISGSRFILHLYMPTDIFTITFLF